MCTQFVVFCWYLSDNANAESQRRRIRGSLGGDVPEKYYIVQNNDVMRVKYLLVYVGRNVAHERFLVI